MTPTTIYSLVMTKRWYTLVLNQKISSMNGSKHWKKVNPNLVEINAVNIDQVAIFMQLLPIAKMRWFPTITLHLILEEDGAAAKNKQSNSKAVNQFFLQHLMVYVYIIVPEYVLNLCTVTFSATTADDQYNLQTSCQLCHSSDLSSSEETITESLGSKRSSRTSTGSLNASWSQQSTTTLTPLSE